MRLGELMADEAVRIEGDREVEITGLSYDSRQTRAGDLFFSLAREEEYSRANVADALSRGARGAVVGKGRQMEARPATTLVECERPRHLMGVAASRFYRAPSERLDLVGVTGTSGKTTSTYLLASIFEAAGAPAAIIGTVGIFVGPRKIYSGLTTPESLDFESALAEMERAGVRRVAAEVSSIGIEEGRVEELNFRACLFTNLGRDHLDYHGTIENYFAAKLRLFTQLLPRSRRGEPIAVVRGDDPYGRRVLAAVRGAKLSFGMERGLDVYPVGFETGPDGIRARLSALGREIEISSPLLGEINLLNILGAVSVSAALGIEPEAAVEGVRRCPGAPGRLERVVATPGVTVLVDYAHKPDALEAVLKTLHPLKRGRLICVFGCGGDRDRGKRPLMGEIAARLADLPILTSDNPRTEDPLAIIAEVERGLAARGLSRIAPPAAGPGYVVEPDRRAAIALALALVAPGDIVVVAGKGHEDYQIVGSRRLAFDDRVVVREIAEELMRSPRS
ncbi:MAG: UDP-N-acetylmuramoyl-L-alanyl-D-glutamate--2,6-diaminopimelate ligase [Candidatus Binataceae bacterium]